MARCFSGRLPQTVIIVLTLHRVLAQSSNKCMNVDARNKFITAGCKSAGLTTICEVNIMNNASHRGEEPCIEPVNVTGMLDFCWDLLHKGSAPGPANIKQETESSSILPEVDSDKSKSLHESRCFGTATLAYVAVGCFVTGCSLTGLLVCIYIRFCRRPKASIKGGEEQIHSSRNWLQVGRTREMGSTSSAQLLANGSLDTNGTLNTLISLSEGNPSPNTSGIERDSNPRNDTFTGWNQSRSSSLPWLDHARNSELKKWHNPSLQWLEASGNKFQQPNSYNKQWNERKLPPLFQSRTLPSPWPETIYTPASECSSKDYQSIQGGSENPYAPCSESSSDYSGPQTHRVMIIRDGEIYQASSDSGSSSNDYTSLKGQRSISRRKDVVYYPTSEGSNKDYASLIEESDDGNLMGAHGGVEISSNGKSSGNSKFHVNGFDFPSHGNLKGITGRVSGLHDIHEYETVETMKENKTLETVDTLADLRDTAYRTQSGVQPHEYFTLEPMEKPLKHGHLS